MTVSRKLRKLLYRFLAMAVLAVSLVVLPTATSNSQTSCCNRCLERFRQCDGTTIVCCKIYNACVQQCQGGCQSCPDQ
jgi:hypothetical protein